MKVLLVLFLILAIVGFADAQVTERAILSGTVYDANGAVIVEAKITATDEKGRKYLTLTNNEGVYTLKLPFNLYNSTADFKIAKYEITVEKQHFEKFVLRDFKVVPSTKGKMFLDFALDVLANSNQIPVN